MKFKQNFERDFETLMERMAELEEKIKITEVVQSELEGLHIDIKRAKMDKLDLNLELSEMQGRFNSVVGKVNGFEGAVRGMGEQVAAFKEALEIQNALDLQDHADRERIAMYGATNQREPHLEGQEGENMMGANRGLAVANGGVGLSLVSTCLSCSG